eukprot:s8992_g3.t1
MASQSATTFELGEGEDDYLLHGSESYATNHRHLNELHRLSAFQQVTTKVTTKVPPSYDGRGSWFAYEDAIDDWCDITELDADKLGPALRNRLEGEAAIHKRLLDRDRLKDPTNGVKYFKSFLRPLFVKGAANVFLYHFQQFMNMHRGNGDMLRWITRSELSLLDFQKKNRQNSRRNRLERANNRLKDQHARTIPITPNLVALIFVSLSDLTQDQRQVLTSLMAHRNRVLADYNTAELREVYLEIFCTTKTTVDNPLLAPSGHGGRKTFLVIEEGHLDGSEGYWVEGKRQGQVQQRWKRWEVRKGWTDLMKFCDDNPNFGIWYTIAETTSQFTFANSESTKCKQKLIICMYDREYAVQSTEFDIVEQGHVPTLMSLPQMRNLRFQFELHPDKALISSPVHP